MAAGTTLGRVRRWTLRTSVLGLAAGAAFTVTAAPQATAARDVALILDYTVAKDCRVYENYPKDGVIGNDPAWRIAPGEVVAWRYNVNGNYAMISDKKHRSSSTHAWWGFVDPTCIGTSIGGEPFPTPDSSYPAGEPVPQRILEGRSAVEADHYRTVDFRVAPGTVVDDRQEIRSKGTLRDAANRFVIGNVKPGWHVHRTAERNAGWTKVYVPNAQRWGWVQDIHF
ncbi:MULTISPECIES: hypothetical protein [Streptomyces]|uniref:SH3 domain-containing protein n=1 Tax=Streptomyces albus (strain ATCC 21838 / DSM 41398 / FERM P-419 / JCM 4703 / NBRC 107858) TaxID=1081613 RepID=A0A0B5EUB4_STRA4|nr:hypothetical protein [Streptomyces sp. SCSIO ZS0520]AJE86433.1 hypothetical protein SLNWT_6057 [Streptomyces albus]AOU80735.1 hypothetical protein SLNHY_6044 [Streptomyces albus]AYN36442.1 hypothetical protein DUI70_5948 [Streptomyces albus]